MKWICAWKMLLVFCLIESSTVFAQMDFPSSWRAYIVRKDSNTVVFRLSSDIENGKQVFYVRNADERILIDQVTFEEDSVFFPMPVFESSFRAKRNKDGSLTGTWIKGTAGETQYWNFHAVPGQDYRFALTGGNAGYNISGKWDVDITRPNGTIRKAIAEFRQTGNDLIGTFLTPSGDYRYLEGVVTGDSLKLSTFDGAHAYTFYARVNSSSHISDGVFYSGFNGKETWSAKKNEQVKTPGVDEPTRLREGQSTLDFTFNDLYDQPVSIKDDRFKNKVVIIQIMGSWCPNCMDETNFLSRFYNENRHRGVEVIALAYEYSTDLARSKKSLGRFQQKFNVQYPMLITGIKSSDEQRTEKTLPQLTPIQVFPSTIFLDKKGVVRKIHTGFYGPGSGKYFDEYKTGFYDTVNSLLAED